MVVLAQFVTLRGAPRSSPTHGEARPSSARAAMIPPTQPTPTMTTSTFLFAMATSLLSHGLCSSRAVRRSARIIGSGLCSYGYGLSAEDVLVVDVAAAHRVAGEADPLPADHVPVAAVRRVGEHPLEHVLAEHREEVDARERRRARRAGSRPCPSCRSFIACVCCRRVELVIAVAVRRAHVLVERRAGTRGTRRAAPSGSASRGRCRRA